MAKSETIKALAKLLIGIAWVDGEITPDELNLLKDVTFNIPEMTASDWAELEIYWVTPIGDVERQRLLEELLSSLRSRDDKEFAKQKIREIVEADGEVTPEEEQLLGELQTAIDNVDVSILGMMPRLLDDLIVKRRSNTPNREKHLEDFVRNRTFYFLRQQYGDNLEAELGLDESEIRKLALTGALMARVAYADETISDEELATMERIVRQNYSLADKHVKVVINSAVDAARQMIDNFRLTREFFEATSRQERLDFLDVLFEIALATDGVVQAESAAIRGIASAIKLDDADYQEARNRAADKTAQ